MSVVRWLASEVGAARGVDFRTSWTRCGAAVSFALFALVPAAGDALSQSGGCARCGNAAVESEAAAPPTTVGPRRMKRVALRFDLRFERPKWREFGGGSYLVCVRACDGSFFPVSYPGGNPSDPHEVCQSLCPNAAVAVYSFPFGGVIDEAVSANGEPYANLPNARKFEQTFDASCSCRAPGQSWAEALAAAEAKYGHHPRDVLVTEEQSKRLSRPRQDPNAKPAAPELAQASTGSVEPATSLDINDVDTALRAAAATMSRATSGIKYDEGRSRADYGLHQGQTADEAGPDGQTRHVRILPPAF